MTTQNLMRYRRFGRTELQIPVFSCGGMRYQFKSRDVEPEEIDAANQANLEATIHRAYDLGINHIETARGYGTSEMQLSRVLPDFPREKLIVQTKVAPSEDPQQFRETFEKSMSYLKLDYVDLFSIHGINTQELLDWTLRPGGCLEVARQFQKEGRVRYIGFSTHATCDVIVRACESDEFDYVNLHWYFVNDLNWPAIEAATRHDMGVFIISPNDKGGKLYDPPAKLKELCAPLTPMQFNDLYCLSRPQVHTLSLGAAKPSDFDEHVEALRYYDDDTTLTPIEARLRATMDEVLGADWCRRWSEGLPEYFEIPNDVNVLEILRLWNYAKSLDLVDWGKMRYNLLGNAGHWFPGENMSKMDDEQLARLPLLLPNSPFAKRIPAVLKEAHEMLIGEEQKRLTQSD